MWTLQDIPTAGLTLSAKLPCFMRLLRHRVKPNGDIVAAGTAGRPGGFTSVATQADFALARHTSSGASDSAFGSAGKVTTAVGTNQSAIYAKAIQSDGKIVAVGGSIDAAPNPGGVPGGLVVARYLAK